MKTVRDVSAGGVGILLARRFEVGTELSVDLTTDPSPPLHVPVRVVRVQPERAGHWVHGCVFERPLTKEQLKALVKCA